VSVIDHAPVVGFEVDESAVRRTLRKQIARLEHELLAQATGSFPPLPLPQREAARSASPRLLSLGELETVRDDLAGRLRELTAVRAAHVERQGEARLLLERMLLAPGDHRWLRVTNADLGEPGCKSFHARPRLGLVGMLAGWWHVKVSSGCPLAWGAS
jgi:hypothetical protein